MSLFLVFSTKTNVYKRKDIQKNNNQRAEYIIIECEMNN